MLVDLATQYGFTDYRWTEKEITNTVTNSKIIFKGLEKNTEATIKGLEGIEYVWVDEAQLISEKSLRILIPTIRKAGSKIIFTLNRITDLDPVIKKFITDPPREDVWHLKTDYRIAEKYGWLSPEIKREIEYTKLYEPEVYAHDYLGQALNQTDRNGYRLYLVVENSIHHHSNYRPSACAKLPNGAICLACWMFSMAILLSTTRPAYRLHRTT